MSRMDHSKRSVIQPLDQEIEIDGGGMKAILTAKEEKCT